MSEKRYYSVDYDEQYYIFDSDVIRKGRVEEEAEYSYDVFANSMSSTEIIDKLNELTNENEQLKSSNMEMEDYLGRLEEENKQLKEALKELKEIGDYQEMRIEELGDMHSLIEDEIDKKIAVLTDAKIKSFQNGDEELFGKIKFGIQVLRELKEKILE